MAQYTTPHSLPVIEPTVDRIKDSGVPAALARDINALATAANAAISKEGGRAESAAKTAAASDATSKANAAKAAAVAEASADMATQVNTAKNSAITASKSYTDTVLQAKVTEQDSKLANQTARIESIETLGGLAPGDVSDATIKSLIEQPASETAATLRGKFVGKGDLVTNVADYLWVGDSKAAIEAAVAATRSGGTIFLPAGVYQSTSTDWVEITKPLTVLGENGTTIKGIRFYIHGNAEDLRPITANAAPGDKNVTVTGHNFAAGDYIQTLSEYNVYTTDAGDFQMGSVNPTTGLTWSCRATEIHKVASTTTDTVRVLQTLRYPYGKDIARLTQPLSGVVAAQVRRLNMLDGFTFKNIHFDMSKVAGATPILFRLVARPTIEDCVWDCAAAVGGYIQTTDVHDFRYRNTVMRHPLDGLPQGSGQNAILIGAGSTEVTFEGSTFYRGAQIIDTITNTLYSTGQPGAQGAVINADLATVQDVIVQDCRFYDCADAFTSHPATYGVDFKSNTVIGGSLGVHSRSRKTTITGNTIRTSLACVAAAAFSYDLTVENNVLEQLPSPTERPFAWNGVHYSPSGVEIINGNKVTGIRIRKNTIRASDTTTGHKGVRLYHSDKNVTTQEVWWGLSDIIVEGNDFYRCGVRVEEYINGAAILRNTFKGGNYYSHYVHEGDEAAATTIHGNVFHLTDTVGGFRVVPATGSRPYNKAAIIGDNTYIGTGPANVTTSPIVAARTAGSAGNSQAGYVNIMTAADAVGTTKTTTVTFPQPFVSAPVVVAVSQASSAAVRAITNVTATSCQIVADKVAASGFNASGGWVAVGQIA